MYQSMLMRTLRQRQTGIERAMGRNNIWREVTRAAFDKHGDNVIIWARRTRG